MRTPNSISPNRLAMGRYILLAYRNLATTLIAILTRPYLNVVHRQPAYTHTLGRMKNLALLLHLPYNPHRCTRSG
jgi:hypothetical protein